MHPTTIRLHSISTVVSFAESKTQLRSLFKLRKVKTLKSFTLDTQLQCHIVFYFNSLAFICCNHLVTIPIFFNAFIRCILPPRKNFRLKLTLLASGYVTASNLVISL